MGRGSGTGALLGFGLLLLIFTGRKRPLTGASFSTTLTPGSYWPYSYRDYRAWATDPEAPESELETSPTTGKTWRVSSPGRIPTPSGGSIPIPVKWPGGKINVNEMLKDVEEEAPAMEQEPGGPISVNIHLKPVG